jgi:hypothetical protein
MLVFRKGVWHQVELPPCVDPSWTASERMTAAAVLIDSLHRGLSYRKAFEAAELYVTRKQHGSP